ncbi:MAG: hypothetical protein PHO14_06680, partial [Kiritimatiellae bacterium]|nr:hypothetical protein [Kiritimatiellia bacterium]
MNERAYFERRHPAHHPPVERFNEPVILLVTVCIRNRRPVLACDGVHELCRDVWQAADFWRTGQYVLMPDHIHLFCAPGRIPMPNLRQWVAFWKSQVARRFSMMSGGPISSPRRTSVTAIPETPVSGGPTSVSALSGKTDGVEPVPPGGPNPDGVEPVPPEGPNPDGVEPVPPGGKLWQRDFWDTQMRSRTHYDEKWSYVQMNPVRKGLAQTPGDWPFQGEVFPLAW